LSALDVKAMNRNPHALLKAALLILGLLALSAAALLCFPGREVQVYGNFSPDDLSQIKHVAVRHMRGVALVNLRRSILKPALLPVALRDVITCRVCGIDRCWNNEASVNTGSPWIGFLVLVSSNGNWCVQGSRTFPPPREPIRDADPSRRHPVSISVPMGLRLARKGNTFGFIFTGFETAQLTVGYKMLTGITEAVKYRDGSLGITSTSGNLLRLEIQPPTPGYTPDNIPVEYRITIYETDQPSGYHVDSSDGKFYRVLWTRTFEGPFE
jgi:hypothetical protein